MVVVVVLGAAELGTSKWLKLHIYVAYIYHNLKNHQVKKNKTPNETNQQQNCPSLSFLTPPSRCGSQTSPSHSARQSVWAGLPALQAFVGNTLDSLGP